jgi:hypothetical protein
MAVCEFWWIFGLYFRRLDCFLMGIRRVFRLCLALFGVLVFFVVGFASVLHWICTVSCRSFSGGAHCCLPVFPPPAVFPGP